MRIETHKLTNAGRKSQSGAGQIAGVYNPSVNGNNASFSTTFFVQNPKYRDKEGELQEKKETLFCTIFNNSNGGTLHADMFARYLSLGKTLESVVLERSQYMAQARGANGELLTKADGSAFMIQKEGYTIIRYSFGRDSNKLVESEIAAWNGNVNFASRPPFWNGCPSYIVALGYVQLAAVEQGKALWKQVQAARAGAVHQPGQPFFGYAEVKSSVAQAAPINNGPGLGDPVQTGNALEHTPKIGENIAQM